MKSVLLSKTFWFHAVCILVGALLAKWSEALSVFMVGQGLGGIYLRTRTKTEVRAIRLPFKNKSATIDTSETKTNPGGTMEKKAVSFELKEGFLFITIDTNKDGENIMEIKLNLSEIPDEVLAALKK